MLPSCQPSSPKHWPVLFERKIFDGLNQLLSFWLLLGALQLFGCQQSRLIELLDIDDPALADDLILAEASAIAPASVWWNVISLFSVSTIHVLLRQKILSFKLAVTVD